MSVYIALIASQVYLYLKMKIKNVMNENLQESWPLLPWSILCDPVAGNPY